MFWRKKKQKKTEKRRFSIKEQRLEYWDFVSLKMNEAKGMYIGTKEAVDAAVAVGTLYNKGMEAEQRIKESAIHLGEAVAGAVGMATEIGMHERDINTCLGLEYAYHSGKGEILNLRKDFKPRRLLKK